MLKLGRYFDKTRRAIFPSTELSKYCIVPSSNIRFVVINTINNLWIRLHFHPCRDRQRFVFSKILCYLLILNVRRFPLPVPLYLEFRVSKRRKYRRCSLNKNTNRSTLHFVQIFEISVVGFVDVWQSHERVTYATSSDTLSQLQCHDKPSTK